MLVTAQWPRKEEKKKYTFPFAVDVVLTLSKHCAGARSGWDNRYVDISTHNSLVEQTAVACGDLLPVNTSVLWSEPYAGGIINLTAEDICPMWLVLLKDAFSQILLEPRWRNGLVAGASGHNNNSDSGIKKKQLHAATWLPFNYWWPLRLCIGP